MALVNGLLGGVVVGGAYALMAVGLTLIFSTTGVLNFAHAGFAMVAAYLYSWLAADLEVPVVIAALISVAAGVVLGALVELIVMRRVRDSSILTKVIATLGVMMLLQGLVLQAFGFGPRQAPSLFPPGTVSLGRVGVTLQQGAILLAAVVLMGGLGLFLRFTRTGLAIRAQAQDPTVARLMGIPRGRVATLNWSVSAGLAAVAGVLIAPLTIITIGTFPILLIQSLIAAMLGGATSLLGGVLGGFAVGGTQGIATTVSSVPGARELFLLVLVVIALSRRRAWPKDLVAVEPPATGRLGSRFYLPARFVVGGAALAMIIAAMRSELWAFIGALAIVHLLAALSLVVMTGWSGQVSLLHGSLVGVGAFGLTWATSDLGLSFAASVAVAMALGGLIGAIIALPSLRLQGLQFGVVTLVISAAMSAWLFESSLASRSAARPDFLLSDRSIFLALVVVAVVAMLLARNLRHGLWGGMLFAVRQSEAAAAHLGVNVLRARLAAAAISGMIAAVAGAFFAILLTSIDPDQFGPIFSIMLLLFTVVGGTESLAGPIIAALVFVGGPELIRVSQASASAIPDILSGLLVLLLIAVRPQGLASFLQRPADETTEDRRDTMSRAPVRLRRPEAVASSVAGAVR